MKIAAAIGDYILYAISIEIAVTITFDWLL